MITIHYDFTDKNVLVTMAEDFAGHTLNKARAIIERGDSGRPASVKTLSFYCLDEQKRQNVDMNDAMADLRPLPDYYAKAYKTERKMPWG